VVKRHERPIITAAAMVSAGYMGLDIGSKTRDLIEREVRGVATVFWNGLILWECASGTTSRPAPTW
jgi:3-phosphoglycerate kinase